jgi:Ca2+-binding RTX toxin-like protein
MDHASGFLPLSVCSRRLSKTKMENKMPNIAATWRDEQTVNTTLTGSQYDPKIIQLANGNILVTWTSTDDTGVGSPNGVDIIGRIFNPAGVPVSAEFRINTFGTADNEQQVDLSALPNGGFIAVYHDVDIPGPGSNILLQEYDATGTSVAQSFVVSDSGSSAEPNYANPNVVVGSATSTLITYEITSGGGTSVTVVGRIYNSVTDTYGAETNLIAFSGTNTGSEVTALTNGNFVITAIHNNGGDPRVIYRIVDSSGANVLGVTEITGTGTNGRSDFEPSITALTGGGFVITYTSQLAGDTETQIRIYNSAGTQVGSNFAGPTNTAADNRNEAVAVGLADGSFVVAFDDDAANNMQVDHYSATGSYLGTFVMAGTTTNIAATALADGRFATVWSNSVGEISLEILDTRDVPNASPVYTFPTVVGTIGDDLIISPGTINVYAGDGNDEVRAGLGSSETFDGGNGTDLIDTTSFNGAYVINLATGATNYGDSFTNFENITTGGGDDDITGTSGANVINTGAGNDTIRGGSGTDTVNAGAGNDTVIIASGDGLDNTDGGADIDTLDYTGTSGNIVFNLATGAFAFGGSPVTNTNYENFNSGDGNDVITGTAGINIINGAGGDDTITSGGNDTISGGEGDDLIYAGFGTPETLDGGNGTDTLDTTSFSGTYVVDLAAGTTNFAGESFTNFENIISGAGNDTITGTAGVNILNGGGGNDTITSSGNDIVLGGEGDDYIVAGNTSSGVSETLNGGNGIDTLDTSGFGGTYLVNLQSGSTNYVGSTGLESFTNFENFIGGAGADTVIGTSVANRLDGGLGADYLIGYEGDDVLIGGAGATNTLQGGVGNDTYIITSNFDSTTEFVGEGTDEVQTTFFIYGLQSNVENLTYIDNAQHGAGVGNILDNVLRGGTGIDDLFGREGNDTLYGGTGSANTLLGQEGDDIYVVQAAGDSVIEFAGQGSDTVQTALGSFVLRTDVENLVYTGSSTFIGVGAGDANRITGGAFDDQLNGLGGDDILTGGSGADLLQGGTGNDQFRYNGGETGYDRILDFTSGQDKIALSNAFFTPTGTVGFVQGGTPLPTNGNSTFIYNVNTGIVSYDDDGNGAGVAIQIAQLNAGLTLAAGDFIFF